jgi:hypothetical protein
MIRLLRTIFRKPRPERTTWDMLQAELDRARMIRRAGTDAVRKALE